MISEVQVLEAVENDFVYAKLLERHYRIPISAVRRKNTVKDLQGPGFLHGASLNVCVHRFQITKFFVCCCFKLSFVKTEAITLIGTHIQASLLITCDQGHDDFLIPVVQL